MATAETRDKKALLVRLILLLTTGFLLTSFVSYYVSKASIRLSIIEQELPMTSDTIYSEIQKDLVRPVLISSTMSNDTFLRDWLIQGESDVKRVNKYLKEIMDSYNAFSSFLVSERSGNYYYWDGVLKKVREEEPRDAWYFRVRNMKEPYEINVDPDLANRDKMTIFINYRVLDYNGRFIGATGIGLTVDSVQALMNDYELRYKRDIFFVGGDGNITLCADNSEQCEKNIHSVEGLRDQAEAILKRGSGSFQYEREGKTHLLNVRYIPELKWFLFVEKIEDHALVGIQNALYINIGICVLIIVIVLVLTNLTINRYQGRLEHMASTDSLTGLLNRHLLDTIARQALNEAKRSKISVAAMVIDIDYFKSINDNLGHNIGDMVISDVAKIIKNNLRASDIVFRWGGEEYLVILRECNLWDARSVAEKIRSYVEKLSFPMDKPSVKLTVSIGIATTTGDNLPEELFARADAALYTAKKRGRNCVCDESEEEC
jgi:diguanylate cyclase (GGDEF)-like protein